MQSVSENNLVNNLVYNLANLDGNIAYCSNRSCHIFPGQENYHSCYRDHSFILYTPCIFHCHSCYALLTGERFIFLYIILDNIL